MHINHDYDRKEAEKGNMEKSISEHGTRLKDIDMSLELRKSQDEEKELKAEVTMREIFMMGNLLKVFLPKKM